MTPSRYDAISGMERIRPLLLSTYRRNRSARSLFKRLLRAQQRQLTECDWLMLLGLLASMTPSPATGLLPRAAGQLQRHASRLQDKGAAR